MGVILLLGAAGGLLWYMRRDTGPTTTQPTPSVSAPASTTAAPETTLDLPPIDIPADAGTDAGDNKPKTVVANGGGGCPATCTGQINDAIKAAAAARAGTAKQCYKTALEGNEGLSGEMAVQLRIGTGGETCAATVVSDTTGSGKLQQCVRSKMIGTYPQPKGGCVELRVPVVFKPKQ